MVASLLLHFAFLAFVLFASFCQASTSAAASSSPDLLKEDEFLVINMSCSLLSRGDRNLKAFIMENLSLDSHETLDDLKQPECRAAFDISCGDLDRERIAQLLSTAEGLAILRSGQCLESFADFADFDLSTFALFPDLKIRNIRHWESIKPEVLLSLINAADFSSLGRIETFPERVGLEALASSAWIEHPTIWQLFLIEGVKHLPLSHKQAVAAFLADERRLYQQQSTAGEPKHWRTVASPAMCSALDKNAAVLARWAIQSEEFMVSVLDDFDLRSQNRMPESLDALLQPLLRTRSNLLMSVKACQSVSFHKERLSMLHRFLSYPLTWRFREALIAAAKATDGMTESTAPSRMTFHLYQLLRAQSSLLISFYSDFASTASSSTSSSFSHADLFGYFLHLNSVTDLDEIYAEGAVFSGGEDERILLSISIRRLLLMLLTPNSNSIIQDALAYVLKAPDSAASTSLLHTTENEALFWFQQARDMLSIPVLDRLIVSYGHEFNVAAQIEELLRQPAARDRLFFESSSSLVRLLAALKPATGPSSQLTDQLIYVDPSAALLVPEGPDHPDSAATNDLIKRALEQSINVLRSFSASAASLTAFTHPRFSIRYADSPGIDAGGLRRAWLSTLLCFFGDPERRLFTPLPESGVPGLLPTPFLEPEVMRWLGWLHGKALQIGTKPSWIFHPLLSSHLYAGSTGSIGGIASNAASIASNTASIAPNNLGTLDTLSTLLNTIPSLFPNVFAIFDTLLNELSEEEAVDYFNETGYPLLSTISTRSHSFSTAFLFCPKFWSKYWPDRPRQQVTSHAGITAYRDALVDVIADRLALLVREYRDGLRVFFTERYWPDIGREQWMEWVTPVQVTMEEVLEKCSFNAAADELMLIDDESGEAEAEATEDAEDARSKEKEVAVSANTVTRLTSTTSALTPTSPTKSLKLISARNAVKRILLTSFPSPDLVATFLFFATGSPQLPAAGLEALRVQLEVEAQQGDRGLSSSHTCSNLINVVVGERVSETRRWFVESVQGSSGFEIQ